jgi:hypothetical protein
MTSQTCVAAGREMLDIPYVRLSFRGATTPCIFHPNMITNWKRQAIENMAEVFFSKAERARTVDDAQIKDLHAKIGQLTVERIF